MGDSSKSLKRGVLSGLVWTFLERAGAQVISLVVQIILARLLDPESFGVLAILLVFVNLMNTVAQTGMSAALIQRPDAGRVAFSTGFYCNLAVSAALYALLFAVAPLIADFYGMPELTTYLRAIGVAVPFAAINSVQRAWAARSFNFRVFFWAAMGGSVASGVIGVVLAINGAGIWALVAQQVANYAARTMVLAVAVRWRPTLEFSRSSARDLYSFGWEVLAGSLIGSLYSEGRTLIIGRAFSSADLGLFSYGQRIPSVVASNLTSSVESVFFPAMSKLQSDAAELRRVMRRSLKAITYLVFPLMTGLGVCAAPLVELLLGERWLGCVPFMWAWCINYALDPVQSVNIQAIKAQGAGGAYLRLEAAKKGIFFAVMLAMVPLGIHAVAFAVIPNCLIALAFNARPNKRLLGYGYLEQARDLLPAAGCSAAMGMIVWAAGLLPLPTLPRLALQVVVGVASYYALSRAFRLESLAYLTDTVRQMVHGRRG